MSHPFTLADWFIEEDGAGMSLDQFSSSSSISGGSYRSRWLPSSFPAQRSESGVWEEEEIWASKVCPQTFEGKNEWPSGGTWDNTWLFTQIHLELLSHRMPSLGLSFQPQVDSDSCFK